MYRDNTLIPTEAIRLAALGRLMEGSVDYSELANEVRHFVSSVIGPSLDMLTPSLELIRLEGLAQSVPKPSHGQEPNILITEEGRKIFRTLMTSNVRAPVNDVSKLVIALKMRFLHLLDSDDRAKQIEMLSCMYESELNRLEQLKSLHIKGRFVDWLGFEMAQLQARLVWFKEQNS
ncbi:MAG: hypothetical protein CMM41_11780 [Rhodospirillaceae bacterium]|nr:hypothetical protein [Rhodospirillaceae bacterium]|tara:strand:+ start:499 stop:1026 length:528 start_codon:yes stop_codon:yes gene_type:complete